MRHGGKKTIAVGVLVSWVLFSTYTFSTPILADHLNNMYWNATLLDRREQKGAILWGALCTVPASPQNCSNEICPSLNCFNGLDLAKIPNRGENPVICGCGQGIFGESYCPLSAGGFSLSGFIGTAPATGAMCLFSAMPILGMWWYEAHLETSLKLTPREAQVTFWTLLVFQLCFGAFLSLPSCYFLREHGHAVTGFVLSILAHFGYVGWLCWKRSSTSQTATIIGTLILTGFFTMFLATLPPHFQHCAQTYPWSFVFYVYTYGFWFYECCLVVNMFSYTPMLLLFGQLQPRPEHYVEDQVTPYVPAVLKVWAVVLLLMLLWFIFAFVKYRDDCKLSG